MKLNVLLNGEIQQFRKYWILISTVFILIHKDKSKLNKIAIITIKSKAACIFPKLNELIFLSEH